MSQPTQSFIEHLSEKPWSDYTAADYSIEQWHAACLIHQHEGPPTSKNQCKLPVKTPSGAVNRNAVHSAAAALAGARGGVNASSTEKSSAAKALIRHYRDMDEKPPASLLNHSNVKDFIEHFGTKGMRWGQRKARSDRPSRAKGGEKSGAKVRAKKGKTQFKKPATKLSDEDLAKRIKRLEMEKRYNDLNKAEVSSGKKAANEVLGKSGKRIAETVIVAGALTVGALLLARKNPALASAVTGKDVSGLIKKAGSTAIKLTPKDSFT
jgi:hypothetical protein